MKGARKNCLHLSIWPLQFKVMPFGLNNVPDLLILGDIRGKICMVYLDDIFIHSSSLEKHHYDLRVVLDRLQEGGLTINLKKCLLFRTFLKFLGHVVSVAGVQVDEEKTDVVQAFLLQGISKSCRGSWEWQAGIIDIPNFSQIADPLNAF